MRRLLISTTALAVALGSLPPVPAMAQDGRGTECVPGTDCRADGGGRSERKPRASGDSDRSDRSSGRTGRSSEGSSESESSERSDEGSSQAAPERAPRSDDAAREAERERAARAERAAAAEAERAARARAAEEEAARRKAAAEAERERAAAAEAERQRGQAAGEPPPPRPGARGDRSAPGRAATGAVGDREDNATAATPAPGEAPREDRARDTAREEPAPPPRERRPDREEVQTLESVIAGRDRSDRRDGDRDRSRRTVAAAAAPPPDGIGTGDREDSQRTREEAARDRVSTSETRITRDDYRSSREDFRDWDWARDRDRDRRDRDYPYRDYRDDRDRDRDRRDRDDDDGLSDFEKVGLVALAALAVGAIVSSSGDRVVANTGDRVILGRADGGYTVLRDDDAILRQPGSTVRTETFRDGSTRTVVTREDGSRIVTIRDVSGRVLQRTRIDPWGRETLLIDDLADVEPVDVTRLPRDVRPITISASDSGASLDAAMAAIRARNLGRGFSLQQIREISEVRALAPMIEVEPIRFATGSAAIAPAEAQRLSDLGEFITRLIAERPNELFLIEGHTDAVGSEAANLALSDRRAESVALALTEYFGVPPENMVVQGYGESDLLIPTTAAEPRNRRVAVRIVTPLLQAAR